MTPEEMKTRSRTNIISPVTGQEYRIRKLSQIEITEAQLSPVLPNKAAVMDPEIIASQRMVIGMKYAIQNGVVSPKIHFGPENETPPDAFHCSWIAEDEGFLFAEIIHFSGLNEADIAKVNNYLKNRNGSESSTKSAVPTEDFPTKS